MLGSPAAPAMAGGGGGPGRGLWPLQPAPLPTAVPASQHIQSAAEGYTRFGVYSLFPGAGSPAPGVGVGALYSHSSAAIGRFPTGQASSPGQAAGATFHTTHKVTDSLFSTSNYTFGAPTPPPGSPYSPVPVSQLELLAKGITTSIAAAITQAANINSNTLPITKHAQAPTGAALTPSHGGSDIGEARGLCSKDRCWSTSVIKSEKNASQTQICACSKATTKFSANSSGCSRTNPVEWTPSTAIHVKREPVTPCQVAEITTSDVMNNQKIKIEAEDCTIHSMKHDIHITVPSSVANGNIPVGIAIARQRLQQDFTTSSNMGVINSGISTQSLKNLSRVSEIEAGMAAVVGGGTVGAGGATILHCGDDRAAGLAAWPMGGTGPSSAIATPTLWQYPAPMSVEPMLPLPIPMGSYGIPMGFQLIRDPTSGHFLLIPTTSLEQLQQAVVWPSYPQPSSHVILPPLPPPPLAPLQLLSSATSSDYLATSTTLHQHTQTHSTRLVAVTSSAEPQGDLLKGHTRSVGAKTATTALSVPLPLPLAHTLIKIEADCTATATATATLDHTKVAFTPSEQPVIQNHSHQMSTTVPPPGLLATHVFYQHPAATNLIISQAPPTSVTVTSPTVIETTIGGSCKSQATSPVCLTPPPENLAVQDAGNQTELHILDETPHVLTEPETIVSAPALIQIQNSIAEEAVIPPTEEIIIPNVITASPTKQETIENDVKPILKMICFETPEQQKLQKQYKQIPSKLPDISGLELLSNSIVEFENSRHSNHIETTSIKFEKIDHASPPVRVLDHGSYTPQPEQGDEVLKRIAHMTLRDHEIESSCSAANATEVDDNLGGLGLLCALAEQRFMEEVGEREQDSAKREKRKIRHVSIMEPKMKRFKYNDMTMYTSNDEIRENEKALERERLSVLRRVAGERGLAQDLVISNDNTSDKTASGNSINTVNNNSSANNNGCSCNDDNWTKNLKEDNNNTITNNNQLSNTSTVNPDWSPAFISEVERDMRQQLADLQRQYKEKQIELSKLHPKKITIDSLEPIDAKKPIRGITLSPSPSPPLLDKMDTSILIRVKGDQELLKPPTLCVVSPPKESIKQSGSNKSNNFHHHHDYHKRKLDSSEDIVSASKKRKVGRPKKRLSGLSRTTTETIVAKKPRAKAGLVGYLLAAKNRLQMQQHKNGNNLYSGSTPPRYSIASPTTSPVKNKKNKHHKEKKNGAIKLSMPDLLEDTTFNKYDHRCKIRPQLKAEPTVKILPEEEVSDNDQDDEETELVEETEEETESGEEKIHEEEEIEVIRRSETVSVVPEEDAQHDIPEDTVQDEPAQEPQVKEDSKCILTDSHLLQDKLRVLTAMGGLFYAGQLTAVSAPDLYAITLDGERGNRPHIMSREEILRDAIVEVSPSSTDELLPGTRLCAYWSQQYRCLYPGTVAEPGTPDPHLDLKFVCVEFDDGDSGRIALEDIRLLPAHYPIIEYDPNPLLSLSKRRRRNSVNSVPEEKRPKSNFTAPVANQQIIEIKASSAVEEKENTDINRPTDLDAHRERKRLKKRRKEKLKKMMCHEDKKKRKKHRCCEEHCKHRKHHKKHRKHKKHHHRTEEDTKENEERRLVALQEQEVINNESVEEEEVNIVVPVVEECKSKKSKKKKERRESVESRSKMAAFLPARQLWGWSGRGYKRVGVKGRARKQFFKAIQRGKESIMVGDCAVFLSTGRPDRPYIGKIESMWEAWGTNMVVRVKWFYHPEETVGCPLNLKYPGALFESPHVDENDVQTISHKCEVLPLKSYTDKLGTEPKSHETIYDNNDTYYLAGYYDPMNTTLTMEPEIPFTE